MLYCHQVVVTKTECNPFEYSSICIYVCTYDECKHLSNVIYFSLDLKHSWLVRRHYDVACGQMIFTTYVLSASY